jgi:hypothetical protein
MVAVAAPGTIDGLGRTVFYPLWRCRMVLNGSAADRRGWPWNDAMAFDAVMATDSPMRGTGEAESDER